MDRGFFKHSASKKHLACYSTWKEKIKSFKMNKKTTSLVNTEAIKTNCYYFSILINIVAFLAILQLALRGKIDAFESKDERGNGLFFSLFNYTFKKTSVYAQSLKLSHKMQRTPVTICKTKLLL